MFRNFVEMESSNLSARSRRLFTLSALHSAITALLQGLELPNNKDAEHVSWSYWEAVDDLIPDWGEVRRRSLSASEMRKQYLHTHGIALHAMGLLGNTLLRDSLDPEDWKPRLALLRDVDWSRTNPDWEGRAIIGGRVSKNHQNVVLTVNYLRKQLGLKLTAAEQQAEDAYQRGER